MSAERIKVAPEICSYVDDDHTFLTVEVKIPGVEKGDISLKMHADSFSLSAPHRDIEYVTALSFCCPVNAEKADAHYKNGLLTIEVPFRDPMEDAVSVEIK
ncbi:MAG: Hsp20/alpha crystallin family protein [bacterium]|nr:MAG: Hsp20/alpha crystallin family protein [bacterium]